MRFFFPQKEEQPFPGAVDPAGGVYSQGLRRTQAVHAAA